MNPSAKCFLSYLSCNHDKAVTFDRFRFIKLLHSCFMLSSILIGDNDETVKNLNL